MRGPIAPAVILSHPPGLERVLPVNRNPFPKIATGRIESFRLSELELEGLKLVMEDLKVPCFSICWIVTTETVPSGESV